MFTKFLFTVLAIAWSIPSGFCAFKNRTYQEVLSSVYKDCSLKKENIFLTKSQVKKIQSKLDHKVSALLLRYKNPCDKSSIYIDSHIVRTLNETVLVEVKDKKIHRVEIASFMEPKEYLPPKPWVDLLVKKGVEVDSLTGATLSQNALKKLVQKYIIVDTVLNEQN